MSKLVDYFENTQTNFTFLENQSEIDGEYIIAKVKGPSCFECKASRNKRWYSDNFWSTQFAKPDIQTRLANRIMFGAWGHERDLTDEELADGKHSHIVTKLWMEGKQGMAEYLILNTPAGRILNTTLRAGARLSVSTRGEGEYNGEYNGMPVVDPEQYHLDRIDFVVNPGFLEARPDLVEKLSKDLNSLGVEINQNKNVQEYKMAEVNESLIRENASLRKDLEIAIAERDELKSSNLVLAEQNEKYRKDQADYESKLKETEAQLQAYSLLGKETAVQEKLAKLTKYEEFVEQLKEHNMLDNKDVSLATADAFSKAFSVLETRDKKLARIEKEFGNYTALNRGLSTFESFMEKLKKIGSLAEIERMATYFEELMNQTTKRRRYEEARKLARKLGVSEAIVRPLLAKGMKVAEVQKIVKCLRKQKAYEGFRKTTSPKQTKSATQMAFGRSLGESLMATMGGGK